MKTTQEKIDEIMDNFDFWKVQECMNAIGWRWEKVSSHSTPTVQDLKKEARFLLYEIMKNPHMEQIASCGLVVTHIRESGYLSLAFQIEEWEVWDE